MTHRFPLICRNCGVENHKAYIDNTLICPICADPRQFPDPLGQVWLSSSTIAEKYKINIKEIEKGVYSLHVYPKLGIGHTAYLIWSDPGWVLWDPLPVVYPDLRKAGIIPKEDQLVIASSHPHMFGAQSQWSCMYNSPIYINKRDGIWIEKIEKPPYIQWDISHYIGNRVQLIHIGGHFPGSSYLLWRSPNNDEWLFVSDTTQIRPNGLFSFQWSYPNMLPLGRREVESMVVRIPDFKPGRAQDNFGRMLEGDIRKIILDSANLHLSRIAS